MKPDDREPRANFDVQLESLLAPYRASESTHSSIVLLGDDDAMRVLIAFQNAEHVWRPIVRKLPPATATAARWAWIVAGHHVDLDFIAIAARVSDETALAKLRMLFANRLAYPDGTIARTAQQVLSAYAATKLGIRPGKRAEQSKQETKTDKKESN